MTERTAAVKTVLWCAYVAACCHSVFQADELEWGAPDAAGRVRRLSALKPDLLLAADCCYIDQDGESPSTPHFIQACKSEVMLGWMLPSTIDAVCKAAFVKHESGTQSSMQRGCSWQHLWRLQAAQVGEKVTHRRLCAEVVCCCCCAAADLCNGSETRVLVSFELRSSAVKETFLTEAHKAFTQVRIALGQLQLAVWLLASTSAFACNEQAARPYAEKANWNIYSMVVQLLSTMVGVNSFCSSCGVAGSAHTLEVSSQVLPC